MKTGNIILTAQIRADKQYTLISDRHSHILEADESIPEEWEEALHKAIEILEEATNG